MKVFRRVLAVYWIVFVALFLLLFLPPYPAPGHAGIKHFLARSLWILAMPLFLGTVTYQIVHEYRTGMARSSKK